MHTFVFIITVKEGAQSGRQSINVEAVWRHETHDWNR